ncbi:FHA domain-containing protein [Streptomyces misionensis]|uniref:FHA domain-containing protein n=1 Tax=Streptomyces misionensis TaxID=67331 RepID=A0A1H4VWP9_9ACTN|nr:FHA domain-containing protein [Streptomyces misionensis]SEC85290.1 FHA domain-containing protein [Streptomyces misionensis]
MPTCPNGHQSGSDDWCEVCGHRMAGAVPPPPPPPPPGGYGFPPPQGGPAGARPPAAPGGEPELCPQCRTPREGGAPFCEECRWNFLTNTATSYTPAAPRPSTPSTPRFQPPSSTYGSGDGFEYQGSRPSQVNRPAEPIPSFGSEPSGPTPFDRGTPPAPPANPGPPAPPAFGNEGRPSPFGGGQGGPSRPNPFGGDRGGPAGGPSGPGQGPGQGQGGGYGYPQPGADQTPSAFDRPGRNQGQGPGGQDQSGGYGYPQPGGTQAPPAFNRPGQGPGGPAGGPSVPGQGPGNQGQGGGYGYPQPGADQTPPSFGGDRGPGQGPGGFGNGPGQGPGGPAVPTPFGTDPSRPVPPPPGPTPPAGPGGQGGPGGAPQAFSPSGPPAPPAFPRETGRPPAGGPGGPGSGPSFGGGEDDWVISPPSSTGPSAPGQGGGYGYPQPGSAQAPAGPGFQKAPAGPAFPDAPGQGTWTATIGPDREYFMAMMQRSGPEATGLNLPAYSPEQQRTLTGDQVTIGRRRHSTGDTPDIDLAVPPEDPGVSHQHAMLVQQPDGSWAVVDQNSTNGTTVNMSEEPIQPFVPVPLRDGDRVHVGAWTTITVRRS